MWNDSVVYIIEHYKAKQMTNKEFYVARFLPLRLELVVIQYLAYIYPEADRVVSRSSCSFKAIAIVILLVAGRSITISILFSYVLIRFVSFI